MAPPYLYSSIGLLISGVHSAWLHGTAHAWSDLSFHATSASLVRRHDTISDGNDNATLLPRVGLREARWRVLVSRVPSLCCCCRICGLCQRTRYLDIPLVVQKSERTRSLRRRYAKNFHGQRQKSTGNAVAMIENITVTAAVTVTRIAVTKGMVVHTSTEKPARNSVRESVSKAAMTGIVKGRILGSRELYGIRTCRFFSRDDAEEEYQRKYS